MSTRTQIATEVEGSQEDRGRVMRAAWVMAAAGVVFMIPVVGFPGIHANFEDDPVARLAGLEAHWTNYLLGSLLLSLGWLLMGIGLFLLCRRLADLERGWSATILRVAGAVMLVPFLVLTVTYAVPEAWSLGPAEWVALDGQPRAVWLDVALAVVAAVVLVGWMLVSTIITRSRHWPTWLGVLFGLFGLATVATQLPLFAAIGAIVLGTTVWRRARREAMATTSA